MEAPVAMFGSHRRNLDHADSVRTGRVGDALIGLTSTTDQRSVFGSCSPDRDALMIRATPTVHLPSFEWS